MYLWDPTHSSFNRAETQISKNNVTTLAPAWTFATRAVFAAAPTIVDGIAYVGDWSGTFYAIDTNSGNPIWSQYVGVSPAPADPECSPAVGISGQAVLKDGVVYVPGGDSAVYALNAATGSQFWRVQLADPEGGSYLWSSLTLVNNSLFIGVASLGDCPVVRGALVRIDLNDPQAPAFAYMESQDALGAGIWSTPAFDQATNTVFITTGNGDSDPAAGNWGGAMMALDAATLRPKASYLLPAYTNDEDLDWGSSPTLFQSADRTPLIAATGKDGILYCLRRDTLSPQWTVQLAVGCVSPEQGCGSISTPAFDGSTLYVGAGNPDMNGDSNGSLYAIRPSDGQVLWTRGLPEPVLAPVTVANGLVYASTLSGLIIFDSQTGDPLWSDGFRGPLFSQPVVLDGVVYSTYATGEMVAWRLLDSSASPSVRIPPQRR